MTTYPSGAYRRRILVTASEDEVSAELEDDFHQFQVTVAHDGEHVTSVRGRGVRFPWTTCPLAAEQLAPLVGMPLSTRSTAVGDFVSARDNCTHMFDLAGLAVAHAARGGDRRQYDVVVPDPVDGLRQVTLERDGKPRLSWRVDRQTILDPPPFAGRALRGGFLAWAEEALDPETAEAAIVLRRACDIAHGRMQDLDIYDDARPLLEFMAGSCFTFQVGRGEDALRMKGTVRDFTDHPERLLLPPPP
jgi:hypothetical protein